MSASWQLIQELIPFCVILTPDYRIAAVGASLGRRFPQIAPGSTFTSQFSLIRARSPREKSDVDIPLGEFLIIGLRETPLRLRGSARKLEDDHILLQLAPAISSEQELQATGLQFRDLPLYDNSLDLVISLRAYSQALSQAKTLANELETHNHAISLAHEELMFALDKERSATRFKNRVLGMLGHEFRTSLAQILSVSELLQRGIRVDTTEKLKQHSGTLSAAVAQITEAFENLSMYAKADDARVAHPKEPVELNSVVREAIRRTPGAESSRIKIQFLPAQDSGTIEIHSNRSLLMIVLTNLLNNAVKYSKPGGHVRVQLDRASERVTVRVADEGIGIPTAIRERIFESHIRGDNVGSIPGSGLGLAIVALCVEALQGTIEFDSVVGEGTEFTVSLPLEPVATEPIPQADDSRVER